MGASIINLSLINGTSLYCCGTPIYNGSDIVCPYGNAFRLDDAKIILGRAALANVTSDSSSNSTNSTAVISSNSSTTSSSASSSHDVAIGAGVGVPLGVIAIGTLLWALWERRRANRLSRSLRPEVANEVYGSSPSAIITNRSAPTELDPQRPIPELMARD
ncbi:hypothetical protein N7520_007069 [Penicillium odoratum]|uniref:uncharacterized protein n=1 Tax=Penicillium odoratum TaxID=1167516 RepID=UPI0025498C21|nr:uncharacterized protein N7520_007069 [Penicillium odoratum]KAJ5759913.1 hypothetical protein N7520_007069 [Penicillium odoratum]